MPWEQIFYGEFEGRRPEKVLVKVIGEQKVGADWNCFTHDKMEDPATFRHDSSYDGNGLIQNRVQDGHRHPKSDRRIG